MSQQLVGHWTFDDQDLTEISGFRAAGIHDGTGVGSVNYVTGATGSGFALDLSAGNTYVTIDNSASVDGNFQSTFDNELTGGMTIAFWGKGVPSQTWSPFISKNGEGNFGYQVRKNSSSTNFSWTIRGTGGGDTNAGTISDETWQHYAATWDGTERKLYIDGLLVDTAAGPTTMGSPTGEKLIFGARQTSINGAIGAISDVMLDDVRIYNYGLSLTDLAAENIDGVTFEEPDPLPETPVFKSLQFDVGSGNGVYSGNETPAHEAGALDPGDVSFNLLTGDVTSDAGSPFVYSDGTVTSEITVDFGRQDGATGPIDWSLTGGTTQVTSGSGVEATSLMRDWIFTSGDNNLGVRVQGLAPGDYDVFALVREPSAQNRTYDVGIGVDTDDTTEIGDLNVQSIADATANNGAAWVDGQNYVDQRITIASETDWAVIIVDPTNAAFGTIEGFQIVAVEETTLTADYNNDGTVDLADYTIWRNNLGATGLPPFSPGDGTGDGNVTVEDYNEWRSQYGSSNPNLSSQSVPEPSSVAMVLCVAAGLMVSARRKVIG